MDAVNVYLLGKPRLDQDGISVLFKADKRFQLLSFLATQQDWVSREKAAFLFWPDVSTGHSKKNLRHLLQRVKSLGLNPEPEVESDQLRWCVKTDLSLFIAAMDSGDWQEALSLFRGEFLSGLSSNDSAEYSSWLSEKQDQYASLWRQASLRQIEMLERQNSFDQTLPLVDQLLKQDVFDEDIVKLSMILAQKAGLPERALKTYESFEKLIKRDLDLEPSIELEQLARSIRLGTQATRSIAVTPAVAVADAPLQHDLPRPTTPFLGRELVLADISYRLRHTDQRLLTLIGPGGIGKTRLAIEAANEHKAFFNDEVFFISLVSLDSASSIPAAIADALGVQFQNDALASLVSRLAENDVLLILDNIEHLADSSQVLKHLLQSCKDLRILTTSRHRLNLSNEYVLPISGFVLPESTIEFADLKTFDAIQLFCHHARRVQPQFELNETSSRLVLNIARLVEGSPLGIELASSWVRLMPLSEIATEISQDPDFLIGSNQQHEDRHSSLRNVFEYSWKLLAAKEQAALRQLSVFKAGFTRHAAKQALAINLPILANLVDKSLLQVSENGRYQRHSLLYQFMQEKLAENPLELSEVQKQHAHYFLRYLLRWGEALQGEEQTNALSQISVELENIRLAWFWFLTNDLAQLKRVVPLFHGYFDITARYKEGLELSSGLEGIQVKTPEQHATLASLLLERTTLLQCLGQTELAQETIEKALVLLDEIQEPKLQASALRTTAVLAYQDGQLEKTRACLVKALGIARRNNELALVSTCLGNIAITEEMLANYDEAERYHHLTLEMDRRRKDDVRLIHSLSNYGNFLRERGNIVQAELLLQEALSLSNKHQIVRMLPYIYAGLGGISYLKADYQSAETYYQKAIIPAKESEETAIISEILAMWGLLKSAQDDLIQARTYLSEALKLSWDAQEYPRVMFCLIAWGKYFSQKKDSSRAKELFDIAVQHSATRGLNRELAKHYRSELLEAPGEVQISDEELRVLVQELIYAS